MSTCIHTGTDKDLCRSSWRDSCRSVRFTSVRACDLYVPSRCQSRSREGLLKWKQPSRPGWASTFGLLHNPRYPALGPGYFSNTPLWGRATFPISLCVTVTDRVNIHLYTTYDVACVWLECMHCHILWWRDGACSVRITYPYRLSSLHEERKYLACSDAVCHLGVVYVLCRRPIVCLCVCAYRSCVYVFAHAYLCVCECVCVTHNW
jgi:hypothetical protein